MHSECHSPSPSVRTGGFSTTSPEPPGSVTQSRGATAIVKCGSSAPPLLADPTQPEADVEDQVWWPVDDIGGRLETLVDGIVTRGPEEVEAGGRSAIYFEAEVTDPNVCGAFQHCAGFVVNMFLGPSQVSAWAFEPGVHQRVWWIDGGSLPPLVIIAANLTDDQDFGPPVDELLEGLVLGEFGPHPGAAG